MMGYVVTKACDEAQKAREKSLKEGKSKAEADQAAEKAYQSDLWESAKITYRIQSVFTKIFGG